jgi:hypothetical protein
MMTAIEIAGFVVAAVFTRAALVVAVAAVVAVPCIAYAYTARAVATFVGRHHGLLHHHA